MKRYSILSYCSSGYAVESDYSALQVVETPRWPTQSGETEMSTRTAVPCKRMRVMRNVSAQSATTKPNNTGIYGYKNKLVP